MLMGTVLRLWDLPRTPPGLYVDEAFNGTDALRALQTGRFQPFYPGNRGREGLFINLQAASIWLFRDVLHRSAWPEAWMLRAVAVLIGILTLPLFYLFARRLLGAREALLALFFLATACWHVLFSRIGLRSIAGPLFLCAGGWLLCRALERRGGVTSAPALLLSGAAFGLGFQTYIAFRPLPLLACLALLWASRREPIFRRATRLLGFAAGFAVAAAPLLLYYAAHPSAFMGRANQVAVWNAPAPFQTLALNFVKTAQMCFVVGDFNWRHNVSKWPLLSPVAGVLVIAGFLRAASDIRRRGFRRDRAVVILTLLFAAAIPAVLSNEGVPHALRGLLMVVPAMMLAGIGGAWMWRFLARRRGAIGARAAIALLLAGSAAFDAWKYFGVWSRAPELNAAFNSAAADAGYHLRALPPDAVKIVLARPVPEIEARAAMYLADIWDETSQARLHVTFTSDLSAERDMPGVIVLDAR
jgi:4-amino-4-deoxy-L-arabinose transferase-like glycosyltransferase